MLIFLLALGLVLLLVGASTWPGTGLPSVQVVSADVGAALSTVRTLVSERYGLTGKPDYLVRIAAGVVPIELKSAHLPRTGRPHEGNRMQLAAYCLLVEDTMQASVPYGVIKYRDGSVRIPFTDELRERLLSLLPEIRAARKDATECHRSHRQRARCLKCGYRVICSEALD